MIKFETESTLGLGTYLIVKRNLFTKGRISKSRLGGWAYYEPEGNVLNPTFKDKDLDNLKQRVREHLS